MTIETFLQAAAYIVLIVAAIAITVRYLLDRHNASAPLDPDHCKHPLAQRFVRTPSLVEGDQHLPIVIVGCQRCGSHVFGKREGST